MFQTIRKKIGRANDVFRGEIPSIISCFFKCRLFRQVIGNVKVFESSRGQVFKIRFNLETDESLEKCYAHTGCVRTFRTFSGPIRLSQFSYDARSVKMQNLAGHGAAIKPDCFSSNLKFAFLKRIPFSSNTFLTWVMPMESSGSWCYRCP